MQSVAERKLPRVPGFLMLVVNAAIIAAGVWLIIANAPASESEIPSVLFFCGIGVIVLACLFPNGYFIVHPNEAKVFNLFGRYFGSCRAAGFHFTNPFAKKAAVSLKVRNFSSQAIKVNDARGNPIEIAAVVVWQVEDSAKASFDVENYEGFVVTQSETAIRNLANRYPYDADQGHESLRGNPEQVAAELKAMLQERLEVAGVTVTEARISHLAYAQEIAQAMLKRQQAEAVIAARRLIVDGAVGMVQMALKSLEEMSVVELDEERKAAMVNNLLVALVSESEAQPIINAGTLYS